MARTAKGEAVSTEGPGIADLERAVERRRAELGSAIRLLRDSAVEQVLPRERMRRNPYAWLALAVGVGLWVALCRTDSTEPS